MKKIIVMGIPHHGNIGDNAIAIAEEELLNNFFPEYKVYYMQEKFLDVCAIKVKKFISDEDIILLHGGGNIGDTYERPEKGRRQILKNYPNNKIIIFPQTAYFSDTEEGNKQLQISKQIYNNHNNLVILAREEKSYNFMKEHFYNCKLYLTPDIVLTLNKNENKKRSGALLLFRNDIEKTINNTQIDIIKEVIKKEYKDYIESDMNLGKGIINIGGNLRDKVLNDKLNEFQTSKIVITDRLHGMIFSAITGTPCIVFGNFNHKISESYKWLKNLDYIKFCTDINQFEQLLNELRKINNTIYDNSFAINMITEVLKKEIY